MGKSKSHGDSVVATAASDVVKATHSEKKKSSKKTSSKHKSSSRKDEVASTDAEEEHAPSPIEETPAAPVEEEGSSKKKSKKSKKESHSESPVDPAADESSPSRKVSSPLNDEAEAEGSSKKAKKDKKDKKKHSKKDLTETSEAPEATSEAAPAASAAADDSDDEIIVHKRGADSNFNASPAKRSNGGAGGSTPRGESTSIFVRGLMFGVTADQVKEHFADCGEVNSVRFISSDHGQCFVDFATIEAAGLACKKDGEQGPGETDRYCNIREHTFGKWFNECAVFVEADSSVEDALREQMGYYGEVTDLQFNESGALVVFSSPNEAEAAIEGGKVNLGSNYSPWVKMAMFKEHYGLGQPRDFGNGGQQRGGRGGGRGGARGGRGGGRGGQRGGGRGGNRY